MDFDFTDEQTALRELAREILEAVQPRRARCRELGEDLRSRNMLTQLGDHGQQGGWVP